MGKFGGFGGGNFSKSAITSKVTSVISKVESKASSMSTEEIVSFTEKLTPGNAAQFIGGKMGLKFDSGKIDGILNRFDEAKSNISSSVLQGILGSVEKVGYKINLPDSEKLATYMMDHDLLGKMETVGDNLSTEQIEKAVKNIDVPKVASEIGLSIEKVPKITDGTNISGTMGSKAQGVKTTMAGIGDVMKGSFSDIGGEIGDAFTDIKTIAKEKTDNDKHE